MAGHLQHGESLDLHHAQRYTRVGLDYPPSWVRSSARMFSGRRGNETALVIRTKVYDYAQYNDLRHPMAYGWWVHPLNTFEEITE